MGGYGGLLSSQSRAATRIPSTPHARATVITTAELLEIPPEMIGKFCSFQSAAGSAAAVDIAIRFGTSAAMDAVVLAAVDGLTVAALAPDATVPHVYIVAGTTKTYRLDPAWTHLSHLSAAATGSLRFGSVEGA